MNNFAIPEEKILQNLDDFDIDDKEIKTGGFGKIILGIIKSTKQKVAIKRPLSNKEESFISIKQEAEILSECNHPSIQILIGFHHNSQKDEYSLITPYYEKGSLDEIIFSKRALDNTKIFNICYGIASAMKYIHKKNISHRDLKPSNILLDNSNYPILIDFGISRRNIKEMTTVIGTGNYMAPEVFTNDVYNEKVDVYSFGLILLEMYTRKMTFEGIPPGKMINIKEKGEIDLKVKMPNFLKKIVENCLNPNPTSRPPFKKILKKLDKNISKLDNSILSQKYIQYLRICQKQNLFFRIPKQIYPNLNKDNDYIIDYLNLNYILELNNPQKVLLIIFIGPYGKGKSTYLRYLTGNQAFYCGDTKKTTTMGILIDGPYLIEQIQRQIPNSDESDFYELFDEFQDNDFQIFFLDSQGTGDPLYKLHKEILDRINSIFCSISSICISIQDSTDDGSHEEVFQITRGIQFSCLTKEFLLMRNIPDFNGLTDLKLESLNDFQEEFMNDYNIKKRSVIEYYDIYSVMTMPFGDMTNMKGFYRSIWFSFHKILSEVDDDMVYTKDEINKNLHSRVDLFFGQMFNSYMEYIKNTPRELAPILEKCNDDINKLCIISFYWSLDIIINFLYNSQSSNTEVIQRNISLFVENNVKNFFPFMLSQRECTYGNYLQFITEMERDLISFVEVELGKIEFSNNLKFGGFLLAGGLLIVSMFSPRRRKIMLGDTVLLLSLMAKSVFKRKVSLNEIKDKVKYSYYPLIWNKNIRNNIMVNMLFSKRCLMNENETNDQFNDENDESNNNNNDDICGYDEDLDHFLLSEKVLNQKNKTNQIQKIQNDLSSKLDDYQLIIFFEQNENNNSSLLFRALSGIEVNFNNEKQIKISSEVINTGILMERFKRNGLVPISNLNNKNVKFIYMKGFDGNSIRELHDYCKIKPILVSAIKESDETLSIIPNNQSNFYLFYLSQSMYQMIADENYSKLHRWDYLVVNEDNINNILNNNAINQLKQRLGIPFAKIIPINSNSFNFNSSESITSALVKYGCLSILEGKFQNKTNLG